MRYLNHEAILSAITYDDIMDAVEEALLYYENRNYNMPDRFHYTHDNKTLLYMPCFSSGILGTKILTVFPDNVMRNHPAIDGIMLLNDYNTGAPKAMIDGKLLTALRTGAVGSMGVKYISPEHTSKLGLIGAGAQGIYQVIFACHCRPIKTVYVTTRSKEKLHTYIDHLKVELPHINFITVDTAEEVVQNAELIITATSSMTPVLPENKALYKNKTFIAIGSYQPTMRELPNALMEVAESIYVDIEYAKEESGDLFIPLEENLISEDKIHSIASLIHGEDTYRNSGNGTVVYKSVGMALFDVIVGDRILKCAEAKSIGQNIVL